MADDFYLCYNGGMTITKVGDALSDEAAWLETRKGLLTSSQMFTWVGEDIPSWWEDTRDSVLAEKAGAEKVFDPETTTTIAHGKYSEENVILKFAEATGLSCVPENSLWVNDEFPGIGASIDGYCNPVRYRLAPVPELSQEEGHLQDVMDELEEYDKVILEAKRSTSTKWQTEVPVYYLSQLQTQMWVLDLPASVIVADTIKRGATMKWRWFWDMRAYVVERDPDWRDKLLLAGEEFLTALEG